MSGGVRDGRGVVALALCSRQEGRLYALFRKVILFCG